MLFFFDFLLESERSSPSFGRDDRFFFFVRFSFSDDFSLVSSAGTERFFFDFFLDFDFNFFLKPRARELHAKEMTGLVLVYLKLERIDEIKRAWLRENDIIPY